MIAKSPDTKGVPDTIRVAKEVQTVACSGNGTGAALGHPKVYYTLKNQDQAVCGYCDTQFVKDAA